MSTFLLVRHAAPDVPPFTLAGRTPHIPLTPEGREDAMRLAKQLSHAPIHALFCSPLQRARETAQPLADRLGLEVQIQEELVDLEYGEWTWKNYETLQADSRWQSYNSFRSGTRIPNGEWMLEAQLRIVRLMERLRHEYPDALLALFSHGDLIRGALAFFLGIPLDLFQRIEIGMGSVSVVQVEDWGPRVLHVNHTGNLPVETWG